MIRVFLIILVVLVPTSLAQTAHIPELNGSGNYRFIAGWQTWDGATIPPGNNIRFSPLFGDSSPRIDQDESFAVATFNYTVTNLTVIPQEDNCGLAVAGPFYTFTLRINGVDTILSLRCTDSDNQYETIIDNDTVSVTAGDRLNIAISLSGVVTSNLRAGLSLEGSRTVNITTEEVPDTTNEIIDATVFFFPILLFLAFLLIGFVISRKAILFDLLTVVIGIFAVVSLPNELAELRYVIIGIGIFAIAKLFVSIFNDEDWA